MKDKTSVNNKSNAAGKKEKEKEKQKPSVKSTAEPTNAESKDRVF